jgi:hypothetical protein
MDNNGWPGEPGVPLNPERDGWHWLSAMYYDDPIGPPIACFWYAEHQSWPRLQDKPGNQPVSRGFCYLGPCLTPAEVESHKHAAVIAYANLLNLPAPPNLIAQARRDALKEAERRVEIMWLMFREKDNGASDWIFRAHDDIPTGDDFVAAIRALKGAAQ